jgi:signal transduction histidine kinase
VVRARLEERLRLAREVHDAAGHGLAAVAMQAGVALLVLDERPDQARASLEAIRATSTAALADLRATLEASPPGPVADAGVQTNNEGGGLQGLAALTANVQAAGLPVRLSLEDVAVPEATGKVAYRVVQEALTNVLRHAGPTTADVRVRRDRDTLVVEVVDGGAGAAEVRPGGGLAGMRQRVEAVGGELVVGPREQGGFRVCARLPLGRGVT